jgi:hypothetical protein
MYIETVPNRNSRPASLLREGWREGRRTRKRTLANLSDWPAEKLQALQAVMTASRSGLRWAASQRSSLSARAAW